MSLTDKDHTHSSDHYEVPEEALFDPAVSPVDRVHGDGTSDPAAPVPQVAHRSRTTTTTRERGGEGVELATISRRGDTIFRASAWSAGTIIVLLVAFVGIFLLALALPSLLANQGNFLTSRQWQVTGSELAFGIAGLLWTTVLSSVLAMAMAVPVAIGVALFVTQYAPKRIAKPIAFMVDLLAAVPSIVYGLWGVAVLVPLLLPFSDSVVAALGWFPLLQAGLGSGRTVFVASIVLAIMILPIVTAISRDVFEQTPRDHIEASWALGATRWEVIQMAVLPYGRSGVISASMLGLGRALGETIAVLIILSVPAAGDPFNPSIFAGGETFASKIANAASEFDTPSKTGAYIAAGLVLFLVTFAVNAVARVIADRGKAKA